MPQGERHLPLGTLGVNVPTFNVPTFNAENPGSAPEDASLTYTQQSIK
jgi:hypothetical protein